jgi:hypothetical protein
MNDRWSSFNLCSSVSICGSSAMCAVSMALLATGCGRHAAGTATTVDAVEVRWPSGETQMLTHVPVDRRLVIKEGKGLSGGAVATAHR